MAKNKKSSQPLLQKTVSLNKPLIGILAMVVLLLFLLYVVKFVQTSYQSKAGYFNQMKESFSCRKKDDGEVCQRLVCNGMAVSGLANGQEGFEEGNGSNGQASSNIVVKDINSQCDYENGICRNKRCVALDTPEKLDRPAGNWGSPPGMSDPNPGLIEDWGMKECKGREDGTKCSSGEPKCKVNANGQEICRMESPSGSCYQGQCVPDGMELY